MTAILSSADLMRKDRHLSMDDNTLGFSQTTDWQSKYNEVLDMLSETRAELDEFHQASKELEAELESELARTEKAQEELQAKVYRAEHERDEWKGKFMSLQTTHNTTTASLQKELDQLRQEHQHTKVHLRELEMGNDDLERNERAVSSSLADMESKYSKALEEKILLEHELLEKAGLEEETQRLKDELRDANVEISIIKDQLNVLKAREIVNSSTERLQQRLQETQMNQSSEDLLRTTPPVDMDLQDISPSENDTVTTPKASVSSRPLSSSNTTPRLYQSRNNSQTPLRTSSNVNVLRSTATTSYSSPSTSSPRVIAKPPVARYPSTVSTSTVSSTGSGAKNKGVQMVSEMRARVRNLEQKIHTRVPRLRMTSIVGRQTSSATPSTPINGTSPAFNSSAAKTSWESARRSMESRLSNDSGSQKSTKKSKDAGDSSGWVLIMEDSPSPQKEKEMKRLKEKRRVSIPNAPTAFRPSASTATRPTSPSYSTTSVNTMSISTGLRRPQSRLSNGASTPLASRPQTPTFLPIPSSSVYSTNSSTAALKRSTGPGASNPYNQFKRSSVGRVATSPVPPLPANGRERHVSVRERTTTMRPGSYHGTSSGSSSPSDGKALPAVPLADDLRANVTLRQPSRPPSSASTGTSILSKSRIGRPSAGRRSAGAIIETPNVLDLKDLEPRSSAS
ncbi:hypothetical protein D9619_003169 [Psilocybe cf. subviscida]|uniref:NUDE domain-containing protein n=1 Tax=Psilocybe cf. subviscida TaxID=2480587 RepID=A0A8H5EUH7_9AGAR|nr:hypothetical protein D9619_003169 [Psilocybe cf. subviscida]